MAERPDRPTLRRERADRPQRRPKGCPPIVRLGEAVGDNQGDAGVETQTAMAAPHLDVFCLFVSGGATVTPMHDPVSSGEHRGRRHRQCWPILSEVLRDLDLIVEPRQLVPHSRRRAGIALLHPDRAAKRHDLADLVGVRPPEMASKDSAQAPTDDRDRSLLLGCHL